MFIHSSLDGHLSSFHYLAILNNAVINVRVFVWTYVLISLGEIGVEPRRRTRSFHVYLFEDGSHCLTQWNVPLYTPTSNARER